MHPTQAATSPLPSIRRGRHLPPPDLTAEALVLLRRLRTSIDLAERRGSSACWDRAGRIREDVRANACARQALARRGVVLDLDLDELASQLRQIV